MNSLSDVECYFSARREQSTKGFYTECRQLSGCRARTSTLAACWHCIDRSLEHLRSRGNMSEVGPGEHRRHSLSSKHKWCLFGHVMSDVRYENAADAYYTACVRDISTYSSQRPLNRPFSHPSTVVILQTHSMANVGLMGNDHTRLWRDQEQVG